ncbi:hypothetical protein [Caulobacter sp. UNC279MFTsu5.1]|uniref:hypothetical protein n=1 Tax=Caulobacter sp. UNC279MFTsu5.1 TaxID=1502775 RepID=UPI0008EF5228|nr:hypothetical protein [Caulobacter sp. UNC279MFTsu5.1]SFI52588.1 hypothetical protein SAMN02799626_00037 [Caulobacter sp. UNC279MFTsu5.1]
MTPAKRPILSLNGLIKPEEDGPLVLATYDVLLPCRWYDIEHKVAVLGQVTLTSEFLLRLLKSADGLEEAGAAAFFGFDLRDMTFVLAEVERHGYVQRKNGRLWLTQAGQALFRSDSDQPQIFAVEAVRESVGFDLLSFAPEPRQFLDEFERFLPELAVGPDASQAATQQIPSAFRRFYHEVQATKERKRDDRKRDEKKSLYSIDNVAAGDRFSATVRVVVTATGMRPHAGEADLSDWRSEPELEDRPRTLAAMSAFVDAQATTKHSSDQEAYDALLELAPEFLKDFARREGLNIDRYFREALTRTGDARSDRPTIPLLGALLGRENIRKASEVLSYGLRKGATPPCLIWVLPQLRNWGATQLLPEFLRHLKVQIKKQPGAVAPALAVALASGRPELYLGRAFDQVAASEAPRFPRALELLVIPGVMVAATVHAPIGVHKGLPVPTGFVSFDPRVIERGEAYLAARMGPVVQQKPYEALLADALNRDTRSVVEELVESFDEKVQPS